MVGAVGTLLLFFSHAAFERDLGIYELVAVLGAITAGIAVGLIRGLSKDHHLRLPMRLRNPADLTRGGKSQSSPCPRSPGSSSRSERSSSLSLPSSPSGRSSAVRLRRVSPLNRSPPQSPHQPAKTPNPECLIPNSDFQLLTSPLRYASPGQADPRPSTFDF